MRCTFDIIRYRILLFCWHQVAPVSDVFAAPNKVATHYRNRFSVQPLTILGVTGPFSVLAENIYSLCVTSFNVCPVIVL